jgi:hypothetical protein
MRLKKFGFIVLLLVVGLSLVSCSDGDNKPSVVDTKTENVFSARDRKSLYIQIEKSYGELADARTKYVKGEMFAETLASYQSDFLIKLSRLEKEGLTPEMLERLKEIQSGEKKSLDAFQKAKDHCNSNPEIAKICSFRMAFFGERAGQLIAKYTTPVVVPTPKQK